MTIDTMLSQILYCLSGFFFGIFASRYSVISWRTLLSRPPLFKYAPYVLFILVAFTLFPFWLTAAPKQAVLFTMRRCCSFLPKATAPMKKG